MDKFSKTILVVFASVFLITACSKENIEPSKEYKKNGTSNQTTAQNAQVAGG